VQIAERALAASFAERGLSYSTNDRVFVFSTIRHDAMLFFCLGCIWVWMASSSWRACKKRMSVVYYSRSRLYIFWAYFGVAYIGQGLGFIGLENVYWFIDLAWFGGAFGGYG
jgi:NhaP-type Na+/H+ or K+/H+ antiporter